MKYWVAPVTVTRTSCLLLYQISELDEKVSCSRHRDNKFYLLAPDVCSRHRDTYLLCHHSRPDVDGRGEDKIVVEVIDDKGNKTNKWVRYSQ